MREDRIYRDGEATVLVHEESLEAQPHHRQIHVLGLLLGLCSNLIYFIYTDKDNSQFLSQLSLVH